MANIRKYVIIAGIILFGPDYAVSQQLLIHKDGTLEKVHVVYRHQDTIKYHLPREKFTLRTVLLDSIAGFGITTSDKGSLWDTVPRKIHTSGTTWQEIIFANGQHENGLVLYMTPEVMKYQPREKRTDIRTVPTDQVDYFGYRPANDRTEWDTSYTLKGYTHYKHSGIMGAIFSAAGLALGTTGIIIIGNASHADEFFSGDTHDIQVVFGAMLTTIGGGFFLAGTILNITSWPKMQVYKKKLHGFSFDMKYSPGFNGLSMSYQF